MPGQSSRGFRGDQIEFALSRQGAGKIAGGRAEQLREAVQVGNGGIELPAEGQLSPTFQLLRPEQFAVYSQLVLALPHVELIDFEATIVVGRANHYTIGPPRAPGEVGRFHPDRASRIEKFTRVAAESEFRGAD